MIDKKVIVVIVIFILGGLFIYSFANPLDGDKYDDGESYNQNSNPGSEDQTNQNDSDEENVTGESENSENNNETESNENEGSVSGVLGNIPSIGGSLASGSNSGSSKPSASGNASSSSSNTNNKPSTSGSSSSSSSNTNSNPSTSGSSSSSSSNTNSNPNTSGSSSSSSSNTNGNPNTSGSSSSSSSTPSTGNSGDNSQSGGQTQQPTEPEVETRPSSAQFGISGGQYPDIKIIPNGNQITYKGSMDEQPPLVIGNSTHHAYIDIMMTSPAAITDEEFNNITITRNGTVYKAAELVRKGILYRDGAKKAYIILTQPFNRANNASGSLTTISFDIYWGYGETIHYTVTFDIAVN